MRRGVLDGLDARAADVINRRQIQHDAIDPAARADSHVDSRVLVIDDNRDAADALAMLIEEIGGSCRTAYDGESGLRALLQYRPDVVLLDIAMPGLDGYETCRRI